MNKIIIEALKSAKPTVEQLMEVIMATSNIQVAAEILLGIYEQPVIETTCKRESNTEVNVKFLFYDKFDQTVTYNYNRVECIKRWIPNDKEVKIENAIGTYTLAVEAATFLKMDEREFQDTHSLHSFYTKPSEKIFHSIMPIDVWNGIGNKNKIM